MILAVEQVREDALSKETMDELQPLLEGAFPGFFQQEIYFKQLPNFRYLGRENGRLVGHVAIDHRVINVDGDPHRIYGIVDLCVDPDWRGHGIGRTLLEQVEKDAVAAGIDTVLLFADDQRLYTACDYQAVSNECTWLAIHDHESIDVRTEILADCLMVKPLAKPWSPGPVDLLGYLF